MVRTVGIVTDKSSVSHTESLAVLLTDHNSGCSLSGTVTYIEFGRAGISLDRCAELLGSDEVQILDVVRVNSGRLCTRGGLRYGDKSVPSNTLGISAVLLNIENAMVNASFVKSLTSLVPNKFRHKLVLLNNIV
jgi:hypothetical protein